MTEFSDNPRSCRVDIWKEREGGGMKWYSTIAVEFRDEDYAGCDLERALRHALEDRLDKMTDRQPSGVATPREGNEDKLRNRYSGMIAVCADPYHQNAHPFALRIPCRWDDDEPKQ